MALLVHPLEVQRTTSHFNVSTYNSTDSEASAELHAKLAGNVDINFRSETFPLERMADILQIQEIEAKAPVPPRRPRRRCRRCSCRRRRRCRRCQASPASSPPPRPLRRPT